MMETQAHSFESLFERAGEYFETRMELTKLKTVERSSEVISSAASSLAILVVVFLSIIIFSIGFSLWIGEQTGKSYYGFFIVGGFYLVIALIGYAFKRRVLKTPVANLFINKVLNEQDDKKIAMI
jgi:membrane-bound ClpP family serine protease